MAYQQRPASYMICLKKGQAIGLLELYPRDGQSRELGFLLDKKYQGQGYMTESINCLLGRLLKIRRSRKSGPAAGQTICGPSIYCKSWAFGRFMKSITGKFRLFWIFQSSIIC
nr:GNAT family N-acetyltransferase [Lactobacillus delbrueckii]